MNRATVTKQLFRSLCANTPQEQIDALENYKNTNTQVLEFDGIEATLFKKIQDFYSSPTLAGPPSVAILVSQADHEINTHLSAYIKEVAVEAPHANAPYRSLLQTFLELKVKDDLTQALLRVNQVANEGMKTGFGANATVEQGVLPALERASAEIARLKRIMEPAQRPMANEEAAREVTIEYVNKAANPALSYGLTTGIATIDEVTRGAQNQELWIMAGSTGHNKSVFMINWARHLITLGNYNVLFYSLEMRKKQVWNILYCSHSCDPKWGRPPLEYSKIKAGILNDDETDFYLNEIIPDIRDAPGRLEVFKPVGRTTIDEIRVQAELSNRERPVDFLIIDYIGMLSPPKGFRSTSKGDRIGENIIQAKQLATDFDNGQGVVVASPHQVNREGLKKVKENNGVYTIEALAQTSEAENTSDNLFCIFQDVPLRQKNEAVITHLKARDSRILDPFNVYLSSPHRFVGELGQADESSVPQLLEA